MPWAKNYTRCFDLASKLSAETMAWWNDQVFENRGDTAAPVGGMDLTGVYELDNELTLEISMDADDEVVDEAMEE